MNMANEKRKVKHILKENNIRFHRAIIWSNWILINVGAEHFDWYTKNPPNMKYHEMPEKSNVMLHDVVEIWDGDFGSGYDYNGHSVTRLVRLK